jgi:hypothetical protein
LSVSLVERVIEKSIKKMKSISLLFSAVCGKDPKTAQYFNDTKRYVYKGNAHWLYPRLNDF